MSRTHQGVGHRPHPAELLGGLRGGSRKAAHLLAEPGEPSSRPGQDAVKQLGRSQGEGGLVLGPEDVRHQVARPRALGAFHLLTRVSPRLPVALEVGGAPAHEILVAAVLGSAVEELEGVRHGEVEHLCHARVVLFERDVAERSWSVREASGNRVL